MKYYTRRSMLKKGIQGLLWAATAGLSKISTAATADTAPHAENPHRWPGWGNGEYKKPLVIIHDGAIEEFMAIPLAVSLPDYALKTVVVMNADCIGYTAVQITDKMLFRLRHNLTKRRSPLCFLSNLRPWNPFPWVYRAESSMADYLPQLAGLPSPEVKGITAEKLERYIRKLARFERNPVTILNLCPLTTVADMLRLAREKGTLSKLSGAIEEIVWMGGAFEVDGNIDPGIIPDGPDGQRIPALNLDAEWNAFSDPDSVGTVVELSEKWDIPLTIFPLDATNQAVLTPEILDEYFPEASPYPVIEFARQMYELVGAGAAYEYSFWDTLTTAYLGDPTLFEFDSDRSVTVTKNYDNDTGTYRSPDTSGTTRSVPGGTVKIAMGFAPGKDRDAFLIYYSEQLKHLAWN